MQCDNYRFTGSYKLSIALLLSSRAFRKLFYYRKIRSSKGISNFLYRFLNYVLSLNCSIELARTVEIGQGCLFLHPHCITFNGKCKIGRNFTILKGATIGSIMEGKLAGVPRIGDNVYVGLNSTVVGNVTIGDNVLIAANTFVNFDVPSNSIVIGSPGIIHHKDNASIPYILNIVQ